MLCWRARIGIVAKWKFSMGFFSRRNKKARARPPAEPDWVAAIVVKMEDEVTLLADWMQGELAEMKGQLHDIAQNQQGNANSQRESDERVAQLEAQLRAANERNAQAVERADTLERERDAALDNIKSLESEILMERMRSAELEQRLAQLEPGRSSVDDAAHDHAETQPESESEDKAETLPSSEPDSQIFDIMTEFVNARDLGIDVFSARVPIDILMTLHNSGKIRRHRWDSNEFRATDAGIRWYKQQLKQQNPAEPISEPPTSDAPPEQLSDLPEIAKVVGAPDSDSARLLALMMRQRWACAHVTLETAFPEVFVNTVIDDMNEVAVDDLDTPLIYEDDERDDWWIVDEHFRDALAHILTHADFRQQK